MKALFLSLYISFLAVMASAQSLPVNSAARYSGETFEQAFARYLERASPTQKAQIKADKSAYGVAVKLSKIDLKKVDQVYSETELVESFKSIRDTRFLTPTTNSSFKRRSTWLYPYDGCWARAALMAINLEKLELKRPAKVFAFGNLRVKTANATTGSVSWWYHVAPAVRVGEQVFILDPSIEPKNPLTFAEWTKRMNNSGMRIAICHTKTYGPDSSCDKPNTLDEDYAVYDQVTYLQSEWDNLVRLNRNPKKELGDFPPWL